MRIHVVGAQDTNAPWAFELRIMRVLREMGHDVVSTDFRMHRAELGQILRHTHADHTLVFKGDWIPPDVIRAVSSRVSLWFAEYIGAPSDVDYLAYKNRALLRYNCAAFDQVLVHDALSIPVCRQLGSRSVAWLSCVIVDTALFDRLGTPHDLDVVFVGARTPRRTQILARLSERFSVTWPSVRRPEELNLVFNRAKIVLNVHASHTLNCETRLGEALGSGAFLLSEETSCTDMLQDGQHLVYWRHGDVEDLIDKIGHYLAHERERKTVADAGYEYARKHHTAEARVRQLVALMRGESDNPPSLAPEMPTRRPFGATLRHTAFTLMAAAWAISTRRRVLQQHSAHSP
jgi:spore maturation protein CgeB